jgi:6-phosphogluconolactonase
MAKFSKIIRETQENLLINKFIEIFRSKLSKRLKSSKRFSFVLTGGKSPIKLYKKLSKTKKINWSNVDFFIGDERYVSAQSKHSNINLCKRFFLKNAKISKKQIFKVDINKRSIKEDANLYQNKIKKYFLKKKIAFDLVLLGVGEDGHIASLFKNNINSKTNKIVDFVKKKDFSRITLTIKCINDSKSIFLWAPGKRKSKIIKTIIKDSNLYYPVSFLKKKNSFLFYGY